MTLTNLSSKTVEFLWSLKENEKKGCVPIDVLFRKISLQNADYKKFIETNLEKENKSKNINLKTLLERSYFEAFESRSNEVTLDHIFLASTSFLGEDAYKKASRYILSKSRLLSNLKTRRILDSFIVDITSLAEADLLPQFMGRKELLNKLISTLLWKDRSSPVLLGPKGVGKTSLVSGLAQKIAAWDVPWELIGTRLISIDIATLSNTSFAMREMLEESMSNIINQYLSSGQKIIFFFDDLHLLTIGSTIGFTVTPSKGWESSLSKVPIRFVGAASSDAFRLFETPFGELWQPFEVPEPEEEELRQILEVKIEELEKFHNVFIKRSIIDLLLSSTTRKILSDHAQPGKSVKLLDGVCSYVKATRDKPSLHFVRKSRRILDLKREFKKYFLSRNIEKASEIQQQIEALETSFSPKKFWKSKVFTITEDDVKDFISEEMGQEFRSVAEYNSDLYCNLEKYLSKKIVGQDEAIQNLARSLRRARLRLKDPRRPIASFLFLGATGVGKSETAKALAEILFNSKDNFLRLDMSDFREKHNVSRLVGAPPGYVGYEEGGQLSDFVLKNPKSIILFDEIEKAHPDVLNILLQIMEEGELFDASGEKVEFRDCVIIMTGNIGSNLIKKGSIGFKDKPFDLDYQVIKSRILEEAKRILKPEFINRLDDIVVFRNLTKSDLLKIFDQQLAPYKRNLLSKGIRLRVYKSAKQYLVKKGYSKEYGARPLRRVIEKDLVDKIASMMLEGKIKEGDTVKVSYTSSALKIIKK